jgi:hypothetical protein
VCSYCLQVFQSNFYTTDTSLVKILHDFNVFVYFSVATMTSTGKLPSSPPFLRSCCDHSLLGYGDIFPIGWASQLVVTVHMIVGWAYSAMCVHSAFVVACRVFCDVACSIISKGISLFDQVDTNSKSKAASSSDSWWKRALNQLKDFVYQPDQRVADTTSLLSAGERGRSAL